MEITKRKYKRKEVIEIVNAYKTEYESKLAEQKSRIFELSKENAELKSEINKFVQKENVVANAIIDAEKVAEDLKEKARLSFVLETKKLKSFSAKWEEFFNELKEKYSAYSPAKSAVEVKERLDEFLKTAETSVGEDFSKQANSDSAIENKKFNPKAKIDDYIAATENGGFNMEEVLNPGELQLEDLCKELGLME